MTDTQKKKLFSAVFDAEENMLDVIRVMSDIKRITEQERAALAVGTLVRIADALGYDITLTKKENAR